MADYNSILPILQQTPLFKELNEADHKEIIDNIEMMYFPAKHRVFSEGDEGTAMYIIKTGGVQVFKGEGQHIANLGPTEFFGEMALFKDEPRNASIETLEETEVLILKKEDFYKLVAGNNNIARALSEEFFLREQENSGNAEDAQ